MCACIGGGILWLGLGGLVKVEDIITQMEYDYKRGVNYRRVGEEDFDNVIFSFIFVGHQRSYYH